MELEAMVRQHAWNLASAETLKRDVGPELWARSGGPGQENHRAWAGHRWHARANTKRDRRRTCRQASRRHAASCRLIARLAVMSVSRRSGGVFPERESRMFSSAHEHATVTKAQP